VENGPAIEAVAAMSAHDTARDAFLALVDAHRGILHKVARAYAWSPDDRDDLTQDILAQLWRAYPSYDASRPFSTWMYRIALNVAISWLRRQTARGVTVPFDPDAHDVAAAGLDPLTAARAAALTAAIHALEPLDRALVLLYLDDQGHRDIAAVLGLSETNVATKLHRLKRRLRQQLEDHA